MVLTPQRDGLMRAYAWVMGFTVLAVSGCNQASGTVSGIVTINGTPLNGGTVIFHPQRGEPTMGWIGNDGTYSVSDVPTGPTRVTVGVFNRQPDGFRLNMKFPHTNGGPVIVPSNTPDSETMISPSYSDPDLSGIRLDVSAGGCELNIPLTGTFRRANSRLR